jgi:hypothetical protein
MRAAIGDGSGAGDRMSWICLVIAIGNVLDGLT